MSDLHPDDRKLGPAAAYGLALTFQCPLIYLALIIVGGSGAAYVMGYVAFVLLKVLLAGAVICFSLGILYSLWQASALGYTLSPSRQAILVESGLPGFQTRVRHTILLNQILECDVTASPLEQTLGVSSLVIKLAHNEVSTLRFIKDADDACDWINQNGAGIKARALETI